MGTIDRETKYGAVYAVSHCWPVKVTSGQANTHQGQCLNSAAGQTGQPNVTEQLQGTMSKSVN